MNTTTQTKACPFCAEEILLDAKKCKHCGEILDETLKAFRQQQAPVIVIPEQKIRKWSPGVAALLSFIIPGAGQMYKDHVGTGILWFIVVIVGYVTFIIPGIFLHIICIVAASSGDPYK